MRLAIAAIALVAAFGATPSVALDDPGQLIRALYALPSIPTKGGEIDRYFSRDLASAIKRDIAPRDEVGRTNGSDYRYDAQEFQITDLAFAKTTNRIGGNVVVTFKNFGKPQAVTYNLCLARRGWRIANVLPGTWDMRKELDLPIAPVRC